MRRRATSSGQDPSRTHFAGGNCDFGDDFHVNICAKRTSESAVAPSSMHCAGDETVDCHNTRALAVVLTMLLRCDVDSCVR